jgi:hypothetical protein
MGWMHVIHMHARAEHMCADAVDAIIFYFGQTNTLHFALEASVRAWIFRATSVVESDMGSFACIVAVEVVGLTRGLAAAWRSHGGGQGCIA